MEATQDGENVNSMEGESALPSYHPRNDRSTVYLLFGMWSVAEIFLNYDGGAIPVALDAFQYEFELNATMLGILGAIAYVGTIVGAPLSGVLLQSQSAKRLILITLLLNITCTSFLAGALNFPMLLAARFLIGFTQSTVCVYVPVWVDEFAPDKHITTFMGFVQGSAVVGVMVGYLVTGYSTSWRYSVVIPSMVLLVVWLCIIATPSLYIDLYKTGDGKDELDFHWSQSQSRTQRPKNHRKLTISDYAEHSTRTLRSNASGPEKSRLELTHLKENSPLSPVDTPHRSDATCRFGLGGMSAPGHVTLVRSSSTTLGGGALIAGIGHGTALYDDAFSRRMSSIRILGGLGDASSRQFGSPGINSLFGERKLTKRMAPEIVFGAHSPCGATIQSVQGAGDAHFPASPQSVEAKPAPVRTSPFEKSLRCDIKSGGIMWGGVDVYSPESAAASQSGEEEGGDTSAQSKWQRALHLSKTLLSSGVYMWTVFTLCALLFVVTGVQYWSTKYLVNEKQVPAQTVLLWFSVTAASAPTLGVVVGSSVVDGLGGYRTPAGLVKALTFSCTCGFLATMSGVAASYFDNFAAIIGCLWGLLFFGGCILPPATGILISSVPVDVRSAASSFSMFAYNCFGYSLGTFLPGPFISHFGLGIGMKVVFFWAFFGVFGITMALVCSVRDKARATQDGKLSISVEGSRLCENTPCQGSELAE